MDKIFRDRNILIHMGLANNTDSNQLDYQYIRSDPYIRIIINDNVKCLN